MHKNIVCLMLLMFQLASLNSALLAAESGSYQYTGNRFRDPFMALNGPGVQITLGEKGSLELEGLLLKGILEDKTGTRFALLLDNGGAGYLVKNGKILDARGKPIKGVTGIVKKKSIILITSDKKVKEVKFDQPEITGGNP